jgi:hypothetical protein
MKMITKFITHILIDIPKSSVGSSVANKKVALSALGEILLRNVVKKVDNAKITSYATI